jgi:hypothetical protein
MRKESIEQTKYVSHTIAWIEGRFNFKDTISPDRTALQTRSKNVALENKVQVFKCCVCSDNQNSRLHIEILLTRDILRGWPTSAPPCMRNPHGDPPSKTISLALIVSSLHSKWFLPWETDDDTKVTADGLREHGAVLQRGWLSKKIVYITSLSSQSAAEKSHKNSSS